MAKTILYIDDDFALVRLAQKAFGRADFDIVHAADPEQGLARLDEGGISAVILDHYLQGSTGVNVEADPDLLEAFNRQRPHDVNINVGVGMEAANSLDFFVMSNRVLNTFSREEADRIAAYGTYTVQSVRKIRVIPLQTIVDTYFAKGNGPDFISIDVEGLDYEILKTLDLSRYTQTVFCVETLSYTEDHSTAKNEAISAYFAANGFFVFADTYINTIFINSRYWHSRGKSQAMPESGQRPAG